MMQIFADDISVVLSGVEPQEVIQMAQELIEILTWALNKIGLCLSLLKRKNFLIYAIDRALGLFKRGDPMSRWMQAKDEARSRALTTIME